MSFFSSLYRRALRISPGTEMTRDWSLNLSLPRGFSAPFVKACLTGDLSYSTPHSSEHTNILLCALPKSASLHFVQAIASSCGISNHQIGINFGGGQLYYPRLAAAKFSGRSTISHCHNSADDNTLRIIESLNLRVIVLTRSLPDVIVSRRDMLARDQYSPELPPSAISFFNSSTLDEQHDLIIDVFGPIYIHFMLSWNQLRSTTIHPVHATFEEIESDQIDLIKRVSDELGFCVDPNFIRQTLGALDDAGGINRNVGRSGRGAELLEERHYARLCEIAKRMGCDDTKMIGI